MKYIFPILFIVLTGCEAKIPDYEGLNGEGSVWVDVYGDTTKDMAFFVNYENGKLVATASFYSPPNSLDFLKDIDVYFESLQQQESNLNIIFGEFPGTDKHAFMAAKYPMIRDIVLRSARSIRTKELSFQASRSYTVAPEKLPAALKLQYSVVTAQGKVNGEVSFRKTERTIVQPMRIH
jgi:hypothetical protein